MEGRPGQGRGVLRLKRHRHTEQQQQRGHTRYGRTTQTHTHYNAHARQRGHAYAQTPQKVCTPPPAPPPRRGCTQGARQPHAGPRVRPRERIPSPRARAGSPTDGTGRSARTRRGPWAARPRAHWWRTHPPRGGHNRTHAAPPARQRPRDTATAHPRSATPARRAGPAGARPPTHPPKARGLRDAPQSARAGTRVPEPPATARLPDRGDAGTHPSLRARRPGCSRQVERRGVPAAAAAPGPAPPAPCPRLLPPAPRPRGQLDSIRRLWGGDRGGAGLRWPHTVPPRSQLALPQAPLQLWGAPDGAFPP